MNLLFYSLLSTSYLFGDVFEHLKKVEKSRSHSMRNIDFIYMINLDQRPEKWETSQQQLMQYGIRPCRFSAVNGWELSLEAINDVGLKFSPEMEGGIWGTYYDGDFEPRHEIIQNYGRTYFAHAITRGTIGICLSHISILQDALDSGYETVWVMEDDIEVLDDPNILSELIEELDDLVGRENWDILFTDSDIRDRRARHISPFSMPKRPDFVFYSKTNDFTVRTPCGDDFNKIGSRFGAHSMIIRRSGLKKLLDFFKVHQIFFPYDMDYLLPQGINLYSVAHDIISNLPIALSDNGNPNYQNKD